MYMKKYFALCDTPAAECSRCSLRQKGKSVLWPEVDLAETTLGRFQDVFRTFSGRFQDVLGRLQDVFRTFSGRFQDFRTFSGRFQDVFRTFSGRIRKSSSILNLHVLTSTMWHLGRSHWAALRPHLSDTLSVQILPSKRRCQELLEDGASAGDFYDDFMADTQNKRNEQTVPVKSKPLGSVLTQEVMTNQAAEESKEVRSSVIAPVVTTT